MTDSNTGGEATILEERRRKLEELRAENKAYINDFVPSEHALDLHELHGTSTKDDLEKAQIKDLALAGRIVLKRVMGNASFVTIRDGSGDIQIYVSKNNIDVELYKNFKTWDLGDIIGVTGKLFKTNTDELTLEAHSIVLITKALRPMPEKHKGLADVETRYRQRYIDLMSNPESKAVFVKRSNIISAVRSTMLQEGFLEVETPMMHSIPGGAVAKPFITHHNALDRELFLRIAPELHLKRLLVGGFEKVFEINRSFRNEGLSTRHNPEFTMLEYYEAFTSLSNTIEFTENMIKTASKKVNESDGYCAALPYFLYNNSEKELKRIIRSVANSKINETYALAKLKIIDLANKGDKNPVQTFTRKYKKSKYYKDVIINIKKIIRLKNHNHIKVVKKFGKACSYPGTFMGSIHAIITSSSYKSAVIKTIKAGGCNCSRANFVGAYFAALKGFKNIPGQWIKKTKSAKNIIK